jgi:hypothetical protein
MTNILEHIHNIFVSRDPARKKTYTWKFKVAVTALGCLCKLFEVVIHGLATGSLEHTPAVRLGVVRLALAESNTLGHCARVLSISL